MKKTTKLASSKAKALSDMGNKMIFEVAAESGRSVNTTGNHPYLVRFGGYIRNLNGVSTNNLPLNSEGLTLSNKSDNASVTVLMTGGAILMNTIPSCSSGGNKSMLPKCLSNDSITLPSVFAALDINLSLDLRGDLLTSNPLFAKNSKTNFGIFSSVRSFNLPDSDIFFLFEKLGGVVNSRQDGFLGELRKVVSDDFFGGYASAYQGKDLPNHDSGSFESELSMADFRVGDNILINFGSHNADNDNSIYKTFDKRFYAANEASMFKTFEKKKVHANYVLGGLSNTIFASKYKLKLPTPKELADEVKKDIPLGKKK